MSEGQSAGITGYYDENTFLEFGVTCRDGNVYLYTREYFYPISYDYSEKMYTKKNFMVILKLTKQIYGINGMI